MKDCGSCTHFTKWKHDSGGLCKLLDVRTKTDRGSKCEYWKGKKYKRMTVVEEK